MNCIYNACQHFLQNPIIISLKEKLRLLLQSDIKSPFRITTPIYDENHKLALSYLLTQLKVDFAPNINCNNLLFSTSVIENKPQINDQILRAIQDGLFDYIQIPDEKIPSDEELLNYAPKNLDQSIDQCIEEGSSLSTI